MSIERPLVSKNEWLIILACILPMSLVIFGAYTAYQSKDKLVNVLTEIDAQQDGKLNKEFDVNFSEERCDIDTLLQKVLPVNNNLQTPTLKTNLDNTPAQQKDGEHTEQIFREAFNQYFETHITNRLILKEKSEVEQHRYKQTIYNWLVDDTSADDMTSIFDELTLSPRNIKVAVLGIIYIKQGFEYSSSQFKQNCEALVLREIFDNQRMGKLNKKGRLLNKIG